MTTVIRAIPERDWQAMSWHQRQTWVRRYARTHRPVDTHGAETCACGNSKSHNSPRCRECATRIRAKQAAARAAAFVADVETWLNETPDMTIPELGARLGYKSLHEGGRRLKEAGRLDLHQRLVENGRKRRAQEKAA